MFFDLDIKGDRLPPKTVCLTYDDGPGETDGSGAGPRTGALGRFLFEQGIAATFFVLGRHVEAHPGLLAQLQRWGHLIGNHTYSHPGLVALALADGDVVGEIARTDRLIRAVVSSPLTFLCAPYGNWREKIAPGSDTKLLTLFDESDRAAILPVIEAEIGRRSTCLEWIPPLETHQTAKAKHHWRRHSRLRMFQ
jgi:peptidoglycan/xylan/chitin deacetylase (PgdA/CDA1 family)